MIFNANDYFTVKSAAERLGYTPANITRLIRLGNLPAVRRGRKYFIKRSDFNDYFFQESATKSFLS